MNNKIILCFKKLIDITADKYRIRAYKNAIEIIKSLSFEISSSKQLEQYKGIGPGILKRVNEILTTNTLEELSVSRDNFLDIIGIGEQTRKKIIKLHITTVPQLKKAIADNTIHVNDIVLLGIKYYNKINTKIPSATILKIDKFLTPLITSINLHHTICGSYRRNKPFSGDIDILIYNDYDDKTLFKKLLELLYREKFIIDGLTSTNVKTKFMGFCKFENMIMRIDIRFIPIKSLQFALLYFTGPYDFNQYMRNIAKKLGYVLNEYKLVNNEKKITSERDIFNILKLKYLEPWFRDEYLKYYTIV